MGKKISVSPIVQGTGCGKFHHIDLIITSTGKKIEEGQAALEIIKFQKARDRCVEHYQGLMSRESTDQIISEELSILNVYLTILEDPTFIGEVAEVIHNELCTCDEAVNKVTSDFIKKFEASRSQYFQERANDMLEIREALFSQLINHENVQDPGEPIILVVNREVVPSDFLKFEKSMLMGIVAKSAGSSSHAAILCRSAGIPLVTLKKGFTLLLEGSMGFIDSENKCLYLDPEQLLLEKNRIQKIRSRDQNQKAPRLKQIQTLDGVPVKVEANISFLADLEEALNYEADGIGLLRTEYLFYLKNTWPEETVQEEYFRKLFSLADGSLLTIRLFDIGGDKLPRFFKPSGEVNPYMGWRGIRLLLDERNLFREHLRAILKAGKNNNYRIIAPMVTNLQEWLEIKEEIQKEADSLGISVPECGILFEVPMAILNVRSFLPHIDFASLGTNDLLQYMCAADRDNTKVNNLISHLNPGFAELVKSTADMVDQAGIPLSVCGEIAGDVRNLNLLVGLGIKSFSVVPRQIQTVKRYLQTINAQDAIKNAVNFIEGRINGTPGTRASKTVSGPLLETGYKSG